MSTSSSRFHDLSTSSSRFHDLKSDFKHYAFMSPRRIKIGTAANAASVDMGAMIQVNQGTDSSTKIRYRIATVSSGNDEAVDQLVAGIQNNLPKETTIQAWEEDFDLKSSWKDKAVIVAAWSEAIASAGRRFAGSDKSLAFLDNKESSFRNQLVCVRRGTVTDGSAQSEAAGDPKSVRDELSTLCLLVAPPIIFERSETPNSSSAQKMWKLPSVSLSADERRIALNSLTFAEGFKPENDPTKVGCSLAESTGSLNSWREGITSNESPRILAALDLFREALIKAASSNLVQYGLRHADDSEFGPYVSNSVSMFEQWQCSPHRMRAVRRRIYAAHLTVCRGIIEQLEQVEIDAFPTAFVTNSKEAWLIDLDE